METIVVRSVIEVLGKPKEHVEKSLGHFVDKLEQDEHFTLRKKELSEVKQQEGTSLWVRFAELEFSVQKLEDLSLFCFEYMPSFVEIVEPEQLQFTDIELSEFFSNLQAKLHQVDMVAKQVKNKHETTQQYMGGLLRNFVLVLLSQNSLNIEQISELTGVDADTLGDFLDTLVDKGLIDLDGELYTQKRS